ncbi:hypothetical protein COS78_02305 [Candidatus Shapirobacteria bacterium CG06_land_8_20_14_3_00_40_12]|uniref:Uncharacterized protein n=2 Tax=Candidatus Shapironibacteriota TaxID=1752721 RepID=A0A2M7TU19_9BACT|nr:MAG: hypothetical protein COS78_02305 [Candidatus Shapirobacteria bacterium CG06_land_8_20_14_3_00_40_12]PIZ60915.1 MAG: hypothetical protein COY20_00695 [Candidatus Shapirobacteria bacterium CG_4_10_14_0_2_um_filter_40_12]
MKVRTSIKQNFEIRDGRIFVGGVELLVRSGITPAYLPETRKKALPRRKKYNFPPDQGGARSFLTTPAADDEEFQIEMKIA